MRSKIFLIGVFLFAVLIISCSTATAPLSKQETLTSQEQRPPVIVKEAWQTEWDKAIVESRKEGKVSIYSGLGPPVRNALSKLFNKNFGLDIEWTPGSGADITQKVLAERRAGLFLVDMFLVGSTYPVTVLKPQGALDPIEPELLLPEITDLTKWLDGRLPWVDKEHYIIAPAQAPASTLLINQERVKTAEVTSYVDLLDARWKGRMTMINPTRPGSSAKWLTVIATEIMGWDYIRKLASQDLRIAGDKRLAVEWTVRGKTDITIAPAGEEVDHFIKEGVPLILIHPREGTYQTGGSSVLSLLNKRPHPYASRVFINWYLGREGQQIFADYDIRQGTRLDLDTKDIMPVKLRQPGTKYIFVEDEDWLKREPEAIKIIHEIFSPYIK